MSSRPLKITAPLTPLQWEAVLECLYEWGAEGVPLAVGLERMRETWGMLPEDIERAPALFKRYARDRWREGVESPAELSEGMGVPAAASTRLPEGIMGVLCSLVEEVFGPALLCAEVRWMPGPEVIIREGDTYEEKTGEGEGWLVGAVIVQRSSGEREVFPECRVRGMRRTPRPGCKHRHLILWQLEVVSERLAEWSLARRLAAWKFTYFGEGSGVPAAAALAAAAGVKKQTMAKTLARVRESHERLTGEAPDRLGGCVPERGRRLSRKPAASQTLLNP